MKLLMLSIDQKIFDPTSSVRRRMLGYAAALDQLFIVVLGQEQQEEKIGNLTLRGKTRLKALFFSPKEKYDLITSQDPFETGFIAWRIARRLKTKLHLQVHTDFLNPYFKKQSFLNRVRVLIAHFLLPRAESIRVVSQRIKDSLTANFQHLTTDIQIQPISVNIEEIKNTPIKTDLHQKYPQFEKIVLIASRLTWEKNIALAVEVMGEVIKELPRAGLVIVGSGPKEDSLRLKVKQLKLEDQIKFEPWTNDLPSYYKTANLFLLSSYYEGYGLTLVEAKAADIPIVSTDVGIAPEVTPFVCPVGDRTCLINHILKILR